ncbi:hypothetical protein [Aquibacillus saliphilus]|uniref:hypothetical protein n=1 Tax=Aquibacillus saliphilus TaxID=1909422 RepID=UPI001CEFE2DC|nr:hypothetical protein [Aquibacillus saliphilus]
MKINIEEYQVKNLVMFLNRCEFKGLEEVQAVSEILDILDSTIKQEEKDKDIIKK